MQFGLSLLAIGLLTKWYIAPPLSQKPLQLALMLLLIPHAFRHIGMSFVVPTLNHPGMPADFATAAAYGDLLSGLLALVCLIALNSRWSVAVPLVWIFNIVGTIDLTHALGKTEAISYMGPTWFIPTFLVPVLLITHIMIFARLIKHARSN